MEKFTRLTAIAAPLLRINIDTDAIIPSREMKKVAKTGLAEGLFAGWRYRAPGTREEDPSSTRHRTATRGSCSPGSTSAAVRAASTRCGHCTSGGYAA
jgi:hypothetical protein